MLHSLCICYFGALHRQHSCTSEEWGHRFQQRAAAMDKADIQKHLKEAQTSLRWSLDQPDIPWVHNAQDKIETAARNIITIVRKRIQTPARGSLVKHSCDSSVMSQVIIGGILLRFYRFVL